MIKMKKFAALFLAATMTMALVACSSDDTSTDETPTIDAIKEKGVLTMMTSTGFPPFEYIGEDGAPAGVDIDLAQLVADEIGVELEVLDMDFGLLIESLKSGKGDIIAAGMTGTPERAEQVNLSECYNLNGLILLVPADSDIKSAADLVGKTVAVQDSTTAHIYVEDDLGQSALAFKTVLEAASAVASGKADAALADKLPAMSLASAYEGELMTIDELVTIEEMVIATALGTDDLTALVNEVLAKAVDEGTVDDLIEYHYAICEEG